MVCFHHSTHEHALTGQDPRYTSAGVVSVLTLCFACTGPDHQSEPGLHRSRPNLCLPGATKGILTAEVSSVFISNAWHALLCSITTNARRLVHTYCEQACSYRLASPLKSTLQQKNHQEHFDHVSHSLPASQGQHEVYIVFLKHAFEVLS